MGTDETRRFVTAQQSAARPHTFDRFSYQVMQFIEIRYSRESEDAYCTSVIQETVIKLLEMLKLKKEINRLHAIHTSYRLS